MGRFNVRVVFSLFICLPVTIFSKWRICRSSLNRQHWSASWSHHQCRYLHRQHHCNTTKRGRFGRINNVSNHYHLMHSSMGEFSFDLLFFSLSFSLFLSVPSIVPKFHTVKVKKNVVPRTNEIDTHTRTHRFHLLCISKAKQKQKKNHKKQKNDFGWPKANRSFFSIFGCSAILF